MKQNPGTQRKLPEITIPEIIANSEHPAHPDLYANHAQIMVSGNEVFIDFYYLSPVPGKINAIGSVFQQRLIMPHAIVKGFATALANAITGFEVDTHSSFPNTREPQPDDKIVIWREDGKPDAV